MADHSPDQIKQTIRQMAGQAMQHLQAGQFSEAEAIYQKILCSDANQPDALHFLGVIALQEGRAKDSAGLIERAIAINPEDVNALNNLGQAYESLDRLDDAIAVYRKALQHDPGLVAALNNLGNGLAGKGKYSEAVQCYLRALDISNDDPEIHSNLGDVYQEQGLWDEAVARYREALNIDPNFYEVHLSLGNALWEQGLLEVAVASYQRAIDINPHSAEVHGLLGGMFKEMGRLGEAFTSYRRAVAIEPQNDLFWGGMAESIKSLSFPSSDDTLLADLLHLIEMPNVRPSNITRPILSALRHHPNFSKVLELTGSGKSEAEISYDDVAGQLSAIPLFLRIMSLCPIDDLEIERMLTVVRRTMLKETLVGKGDDKDLAFSAALALQCFTNEYIYSETDEEKAAVEQLHQQIAALVEKEHDIHPSLVTALGAYRPLYGLPWARDVCDREWAGDIKQVIKRQLSEPLEEQSLRSQFPQLTAIQDGVSQSVREQYEKNPYPRWVETNITEKGNDIRTVLKRTLLHFELGDYQSPESPEILVAGCGTGQHALGTATRFSNARVLALDLSLSSLSYALRKTKEFEISNIEFAQADIMELSGLGRQFDLIESVGVLHHLENPLAGWRNLVGLLRPGGFMKIGLYGKIDRKDIVSGRSLIAEKGYASSPEDIRRCRQDIISRAEDGNRKMARLCNRPDFFSLSNCRDLIFHVQEHRFTLPQIEEALQALNLEFLGFELADQSTMKKFKASFPKKRALTSLSQWHKFELKNPDTIAYVFWCRKM